MSPLFGRRVLPAALLPRLVAFHEALIPLESGKEALVEMVPQARYPGRPFPESLRLFIDGLAATAELMPAWRDEALEADWRACDAGIRKARERAEHAAPAAEGRTFEGLLELVQELLDPLEPFERAEERFRELRVRG